MIGIRGVKIVSNGVLIYKGGPCFSLNVSATIFIIDIVLLGDWVEGVENMFWKRFAC